MGLAQPKAARASLGGLWIVEAGASAAPTDRRGLTMTPPNHGHRVAPTRARPCSTAKLLADKSRAFQPCRLTVRLTPTSGAKADISERPRQGRQIIHLRHDAGIRPQRQIVG